jgi:hypothetical protein
MRRDRSSTTLGRRLVECGNGREWIVGYVAGWVAMVDGAPAGFVRSSPRQARKDLLAFALATTPGGVASVGNAAPALP